MGTNVGRITPHTTDAARCKYTSFKVCTMDVFKVNIINDRFDLLATTGVPFTNMAWDIYIYITRM